VARAIHASNRGDVGTRIENAGKCGLDETGKQEVNESDEGTFAAVSMRDGSPMRVAFNTGLSIVIASEATRLRLLRKLRRSSESEGGSNPASSSTRKAGLLRRFAPRNDDGESYA
jgi:hypothetical protein